MGIVVLSVTAPLWCGGCTSRWVTPSATFPDSMPRRAISGDDLLDGFHPLEVRNPSNGQKCIDCSLREW